MRTFRRMKMPLHVKENMTIRHLRDRLAPALCALLLFSTLGEKTLAQEPAAQHARAVTALGDLLQEAEKNNPQIEAARQGWQGAKQVPTQVSTLPDPQFAFLHLNVSRPPPFAGHPHRGLP